MSVRVDLPAGDAEFVRLRRALTHSRCTSASFDHTLPKCDFAARFWSERAWSEYAAVPAMAQIVLGMIRDGSTTNALGAMTAISQDEVLHTELSRDLAEGFGSYHAEVPEQLSYAPASLAEPSTATIAQWLMVTCISETSSAALMRARLSYTTHPVVADVLKRVLRDERVHMRTAWSLAEHYIPTLPEHIRNSLAEQAEFMFESLGSTFATAGLPDGARHEARRMREVVATSGLGAAPPDVGDQVCFDTIENAIVPRLKLLKIL